MGGGCNQRAAVGAVEGAGIAAVGGGGPVAQTLQPGLRGKGGGYRLRKSPDQYGVREILSLLEGPLVPVACLGPGDQSCDRMTSCRTLPLWQGLEQVIQEYLDKYTIADLMARDETAGFDYVI